MTQVACQQKNDDLIAITALRGIAAVMVCVLHFSTAFLPKFGAITDQYTDFISNSYLWVDFFFLLSGFVLTHVYQQTFSEQVGLVHYRKFMLARFARIYPLHLFTLMLILCIEIVDALNYIQQYNLPYFLSVWPYAVDGLVFTGSTDPKSFIKNIFLIHSMTTSPVETSWNHPAWSIGTEWVAYFLIPIWIFLLYRKMVFSNGLPILLITTLISSFGVIIWIGSQTTDDLDVAGFIGLIRCVFEGIIGICVYAIYIRWRPAEFLTSTFALSLLLMTMILIMHWNITDAIIVPVFVLIILFINSHRGIYHKILTTSGFVYLGVISYSIYMIHTPVRKILSDLSEAMTGTVPREVLTNFESLLAMPVAIFIVILISHFSYQYIEVPARDYIRHSERIKHWLRI